MTYQLGDAIEATRRLLYGSSRPMRNQLNTGIDATTTTVIYNNATNAPQLHSIISIGDELLYVWDRNDTTKTLTVARGELGTTPAAHAALDAIEINPRFARAFISQAIQDEIRSWEPVLYRVTDASLSTTCWPGLIDAVGVDQPYGVVSARYRRDTAWVDFDARLQLGLSVTDFPSGAAVQLFAGTMTRPCTPTSLRVSFAVPFDLDGVTESADLVDDVGLGRSMCDLAVWGAAIRLLAPAEVSRTDPTAQSQARDATQVRVGDQVQVAAALQRKRDMRFSEEVAKLTRRYPLRF